MLSFQVGRFPLPGCRLTLPFCCPYSTVCSEGPLLSHDQTLSEQGQVAKPGDKSAVASEETVWQQRKMTPHCPPSTPETPEPRGSFFLGWTCWPGPWKNAVLASVAAVTGKSSCLVHGRLKRQGCGSAGHSQSAGRSRATPGGAPLGSTPQSLWS